MIIIYFDLVWGIIQPATAHYYFKKMEVFQVCTNSESLIEDVDTLENAIQRDVKLAFEMGTLEDFKMEYNQVVKTTREKNKYPFKEWLNNKRELILNQI